MVVEHKKLEESDAGLFGVIEIIFDIIVDVFVHQFPL